MTKRLRLIYVLLLAVALPLLTACLNDDAVNGNEAQQDGKITVRLRLSQAASNAMRAVGEYDENATIEELMNVWTVVVTDASGNVSAIYACKPSTKEEQEIDEVAELPHEGTYRFYSFANMSPKYVLDMLGITATTQNIVSFMDDEVFPKTAVHSITYNTTTLTDSEIKAKTIGVDGNLFDPTVDNQYGAKGIPMSNVQEFSVKNGDTKNLIVVRLLAKIELRIYNDKGSDVTIESITLTDVTQYEEGKDNLKLFPNYTVEDPNGADEKVDYKHGDIHPNLNNNINITTGDVSVKFTQETKKVSATTNSYANNDDPVKIVFYVNESDTPTNKPVDFSHFFLKIKLNGEEEARYALIDDKNAKDYDGEWDYIARNDYRIIPIVLDDYKLDMIPYDFPAIGVHPASIKEEDGIYTVTFHDYGHFHLLPQVTRYSSPTTVIPYGETTGDYWTLYGGTFSSAWGSWEDATKTTEYDNETANPAFYRKEANVTSPNIDADDAGGVPVWYLNDNTKPQWSPNGSTTYPPFIFGYIADPESELTTDRKVYHEFSIYLYKNGSTARQMIYRLYMILDTDQMLYAPRNNAAPRVRCLHHSH